MMKKIGNFVVTESFSILDLPEPQRSRSLRTLGMTAEEFAANMEAHDACIAEKDEHARATGRNAGLHYTDGLPAVTVDGEGEPVLFPTGDKD